MMGVWYMINNYSKASTLLVVGLVFTFVFIVSALVEIWKSPSISVGAKILWTGVILMGNTLGGLIYILVGRKGII